MIAEYKPMTALQLIYLLLAGLSATGGQYTITAAYIYAPARDISVYDYSQISFFLPYSDFSFSVRYRMF